MTFNIADVLLSDTTQTYRTESEAAVRMRLSKRTFERHRQAGTGPMFVKLGGRVLYRDADLDAWAASNIFRSTSEYPR
jgi:predicted DNA-binding transcriptional regulator AlpA